MVQLVLVLYDDLGQVWRSLAVARSVCVSQSACVSEFRAPQGTSGELKSSNAQLREVQSFHGRAELQGMMLQAQFSGLDRLNRSMGEKEASMMRSAWRSANRVGTSPTCIRSALSTAQTASTKDLKPGRNDRLLT